MRVATVFGENPQIVGFAPSALYALASGTVPDEVREEFIERAEAGEYVTHKDVKARLSHEETMRIAEEMRKPTKPESAMQETSDIPLKALSDLPYERIDATTGEVIESSEISSVSQSSAPQTQQLSEVKIERERRREEARREAETANQILTMVGDPNGEIARSKLKAHFTAARAAAQSNLFGLDPVSVATTLSHDDSVTVGWFITDARQWLTALEAEMKRPIRLLTRKGA
jgi:hypothetical protein